MSEQHRGCVNELRNPEITSLIADRLNELRKRLLDFSRRNPLVDIQFRTNTIRVVDELPDIIRHNLTASRKMKLAPLRAFEEELPDEGTDSFLDALHLARNEDEIYLAELSALAPDSATYAGQELKAERALKDRLREALGLPRRQTKDALSLIEHAKAHGISPSYILPSPDDGDAGGRHTDGDIQTLLLPEKRQSPPRGRTRFPGCPSLSPVPRSGRRAGRLRPTPRPQPPVLPLDAVWR